MKKQMRLQVTVLYFFVVFFSGCAHCMAVDQEEMLKLGSALIHLSAAVESTACCKNPPAGLNDDELLRFATSHDPGLLHPFADYKLRVLVQDKHAIVLVCTKDGKRGLLEDAGCSAKMEKHLWEEKPARPCEFTLTVAEACK